MLVAWLRHGTVVSMVVLGCVLAALAVVLVLVGVLAWTRHLPGNKYVGIKVPEVRESREVWDAVHQFARRHRQPIRHAEKRHAERRQPDCFLAFI